MAYAMVYKLVLWGAALAGVQSEPTLSPPVSQPRGTSILTTEMDRAVIGADT